MLNIDKHSTKAQKDAINEKLRALKSPFVLTEEKRDGINMLTCPACTALISDEGASVFTSSSDQWLAIVITVIVDVISGCTKEERNKAFKAAGIWDGTFTHGKTAKLNSGWYVKASANKNYGLLLQILKEGKNKHRKDGFLNDKE